MNIRLNGGMMINDDIFEFDDLDIEVEGDTINYEEVIYDEYSDEYEDCENYIDTESFLESYADKIVSANKNKDMIKLFIMNIVREIQGL